MSTKCKTLVVDNYVTICAETGEVIEERPIVDFIETDHEPDDPKTDASRRVFVNPLAHDYFIGSEPELAPHSIKMARAFKMLHHLVTVAGFEQGVRERAVELLREKWGTPLADTPTLVKASIFRSAKEHGYLSSEICDRMGIEDCYGLASQSELIFADVGEKPQIDVVNYIIYALNDMNVDLLKRGEIIRLAKEYYTTLTPHIVNPRTRLAVATFLACHDVGVDVTLKAIQRAFNTTAPLSRHIRVAQRVLGKARK